MRFAIQDPDLKSKIEAAPDILFYDGDCGLCHRAVRFTARRDPDATRFRYAPIGGETFARHIPPAARSRLPDSIVILTPDGDVLVRWRAVDRMLLSIGGPWRALARIARLVPRPLMDLAYRLVASTRRLFFARPRSACPFPDQSLLARLDP